MPCTGTGEHMVAHIRSVETDRLVLLCRLSRGSCSSYARGLVARRRHVRCARGVIVLLTHTHTHAQTHTRIQVILRALAYTTGFLRDTFNIADTLMLALANAEVLINYITQSRARSTASALRALRTLRVLRIVMGAAARTNSLFLAFEVALPTLVGCSALLFILWFVLVGTKTPSSYVCTRA